MKNLRLLILLLSFASFFSTVKAQNISNEGMEFWTVFPSHRPSGGVLAEMNVNVTSKFNTEVTVSCGATTQTKTIPANTVVTFLVSRAQSYIDESESNQNLINRGIHIVVTPGMPKIVAYSHVFAAARSAATLILPVEALGQQYYAMNYTQDNQGRNFLAVVATEDNTDLVLHRNGTTLAINGLKKGDVYQYMMPSEDLTGTYIETAANSSCKKFAAFSGSSGMRIGGNTGGVDPLLQQLYAINSWGKTYGVVPFVNRRYIVRVLAQEDNTTINFDGVSAGMINKGQFIERVLIEPTIVSSDKLISVAEYSYTQEHSSPTGNGLPSGDPEMVLLNPVEFNIKNITLFSSDKFRILERYLNVFMKTDKASSFKINGLVPNNGTWQVMPSNPAYSYIQIAVYEESLTLTADDGFNAIAYGFGDHESYAYSAGTNLASSQFLLVVNKSTNNENAAACVGQQSDLRITLPYELEKIIWQFVDGSPDYPDLDPNPVITGTSTKLYTYTAPVNKVFSVVGATQVTALATLVAGAGSCYTNEVELIFNFNVDPLAVAKIGAPTNGCAGDEVKFMDESSSMVVGKSITSWKWDFGDGSPISTDKNPVHTFSNAGNYIVKLSVSAENGCFSTVVEHNILINPKANVAFLPAAVTCLASDILFTDQSTVAVGNIVKWNWDFGDPSSSANTSALQNPTHIYNAIGNYNITLTVETNNGCVSSLTKSITINDLPKVEFTVPDVCLADAEAIFVNKSTDFDGLTETGLTYLWNFGDPSSSSNTSTERNGKHKYNASGDYFVTLTVTNANGCSVTSLATPFIVNGSNPKANFEVLNPTNLCSNTDFMLKNTSTVDFGNVTKIQWFLDGVKYGNDDLDPTFNKEYTFNIPQFTSPLTKVIKVKMVAYSGGTCENVMEKDIILLASPIVEFYSVNPLCENSGTIQFTAKETGGLQGAGVYTGKGISISGLFNPLIAGVGIHTITYTFTAQNGCKDQKSQSVEVFPTPTVDAGSDFFILAGGEKQISATASGIDLTYEWTPSIGLSRTDILNPIAKPEVDTKYTLKVTSSQGCISFDDILVKVLQGVEAPNTFSPNGDGINDLWNIKYLDTYPNSTVEIFDRNGQKVYASSRGYAVPFDGNFNKKALPVGTYYYIINPNSGRKNITGNLTIIR
ncbi:PKD domain-containing protein [Pedobacter cryotolerans]|uniref:PKD domain-containing protein n=1 Tax=Pedobacter cryotolerans TaxID=2571270 RepID=A0A4U1C5U5_9SPHI|nr:PKD domain-containing protein [Pedobacter cryotolerans]TKC01358.1 PKD domain-containing protein [Pedobacter cryotolerans]